MSEARGLLKTCDRCGETVFLKAISDGVTDGGYTKWNRFEDAPEGWEWRKETGTLCPNCYAEYIDILEQFKRQKATDIKVRARLSDADSLRKEIDYVQDT